jgi:hypothetical protein
MIDDVRSGEDFSLSIGFGCSLNHKKIIKEFLK